MQILYAQLCAKCEDLESVPFPVNKRVVARTEIGSAEEGPTNVKGRLKDEWGLEESREILSTKLKLYF